MTWAFLPITSSHANCPDSSEGNELNALCESFSHVANIAQIVQTCKNFAYYFHFFWQKSNFLLHCSLNNTNTVSLCLCLFQVALLRSSTTCSRYKEKSCFTLCTVLMSILTIERILSLRSMDTSSTASWSSCGIFFRALATVSGAVPLTIATIAPFLPCASLLWRMVYTS